MLDRQKLVRTSWALWLPVVWILIVGSRPVSGWWGESGQTVEATLDGSPVDAAVFGMLLVGGLFVLIVRHARAWELVRANPVVVLYFVYCLASVTWSPFPAVAFKRWMKAVGDPVMILVVLTDVQPVEAVKRLFLRVGAILMPASIYMIRYSELGRGYDPDGHPMNTGVTTNKNTLGLLTFIVGLSVLWSIWTLLRDKEDPNRGRRLLARFALLGVVMVVLIMAQSATAVACFMMGSALIALSTRETIRSRPAVFHVVMVTFALAGGGFMLFGGTEMVLGALGRDSNLTGRTEIWRIVMSLAQHPYIGTGFESFWNAAIKTVRMQEGFIYRNLNSSHNGYIELYLNLGLIGVSMVVLILVAGYLRACRAVHRHPEIGGLLLAFVVTSAFYSVTEAGFRMLSLAWISLLLALAGGSAVGDRVGSSVAERPSARAGLPSRPTHRSFNGARPTVWSRSRL
jgi:O-antigen ligase